LKAIHTLLIPLGILPTSQGATLFGPSLYFSERDSPFYSGIVDNAGAGIYLEDFEDGELNTPNVRQPLGQSAVGQTFRSRFPDAVVQGVDGDDGVIDGMTGSGDTWITVTNNGTISQFTDFEFLPDSNGNYPLYVGIVITQVINPDSDLEIGWLSPEGESLFDDGEFDPKDWSPLEGAPLGSPLNMRFIGLYAEEGISALILGNAGQVDHLQYGYSIPEPSTSGLCLLAGFLGLLTRRKR